MANEYYTESLLSDWAARKETSIPAPLSVRSSRYRTIIATILRSRLASGAPILSIGAGTGITEQELQKQGFLVTASDIHPESLALCAKRDLPVLSLDILNSSSESASFEAAYADGVLGHFHPATELAIALGNIRRFVAPKGWLLVSNDLSDSDDRWNLGVHARPGVNFFRPPQDGYVDIALLRGWAHTTSRVIRYKRPGRGWRRRELALFRSATDEQKDGKE